MAEENRVSRLNRWDGCQVHKQVRLAKALELMAVYVIKEQLKGIVGRAYGPPCAVEPVVTAQ